MFIHYYRVHLQLPLVQAGSAHCTPCTVVVMLMKSVWQVPLSHSGQFRIKVAWHSMYGSWFTSRNHFTVNIGGGQFAPSPIPAVLKLLTPLAETESTWHVRIMNWTQDTEPYTYAGVLWQNISLHCLQIQLQIHQSNGQFGQIAKNTVQITCNISTLLVNKKGTN